MNEALVTTLVFVLVFIVVPWGLIGTLRLVGRRRGYGDLYAPPQEEPPADRPLRCRLNLFHRWRAMRTPTGDRYQRCLDCGKTRDVPTVGPLPSERWPEPGTSTGRAPGDAGGDLDGQLGREHGAISKQR